MGAVRSVDFSADSRHLLTSSDDKTAKASFINANSMTAIFILYFKILYSYGVCLLESLYVH